MGVDRTLATVLGVVSAAVLEAVALDGPEVVIGAGTMYFFAAVFSYGYGLVLDAIVAWRERNREMPRFLEAQSVARRRPALEPLDPLEPRARGKR